MREEAIVTLTGIVVIALIMLGAIALALGSVSPTPRLVGFGCAGAGGPLYAEEEDDFPFCTRIEEVNQ